MTQGLTDASSDVSGHASAAPSMFASARRRKGPTSSASALSSALVLGLLTLGVIGWAADIPSLRAACLTGAMFYGTGAAVLQLGPPLRAAPHLALALLLSASVTIIGGTFMASIGWWHPALLFIVVANVVTTVHLTALGRRVVQHRRTLPASRVRRGLQRPTRSLLTPSVLCSALGLALWLSAALMGGQAQPGMVGFLSHVSPQWYAGLVLTLAAVVTARRDKEYEVALAVILLSLALTLTPALFYGLPQATSAAKHVGLIQQIRVDHRTFPSLNIYQAWPGFFAGLAWVCDVAGIRDPMRVATMWPVLVGPWTLVTFRYLCGNLAKPGYWCWAGATLLLLGNAIGADYFSPQSLGFVMGLALVGMALGSNRDRTGKDRTVRLAGMLLAGCALAVTHQLTPYVIAGVLVVLVVLRVVKAWWIPFAVLIPSASWAIEHRGALRGFLSLSLIGRLSNFRPPSTVASAGLDRLLIVRLTSFAVVIGVLVLGLLAVAALRKNPRNATLWAFTLAPGVGGLAMIVSPYGNEAIFRAMLFAVPWLAIAALGTLLSRDGRLRVVTFTMSVAVLLTTFLVATFGLDASSVIRKGDLAALRHFESEAPPGSAVLSLGDGDLPVWPTSRYPLVAYISRTDPGLDAPVVQAASYNAASDIAAITASLVAYAPSVWWPAPLSWRQSSTPPALYAIWSPTSMYYDWEYGLQLPDQFRTLRTGMLQSPYWHVAFVRDGTYLFVLDRGRYDAWLRNTRPAAVSSAARALYTWNRPP